MNKEEKAVVVEEITTQLQSADAVFAVDYRGLSVAQISDLRAKLREADAKLQVVKNSLVERAVSTNDLPQIGDFLEGPTALTFVNGDVVSAAKALADCAKETETLQLKGGAMAGEVIDAQRIQALAKLPSRDVLYGQLVGLVASPLSGLARTLGALISGVTIQLGQVLAMKEAGEISAGDSKSASASEEPQAQPEDSAPKSAENDEPNEVADAGSEDNTENEDASKEEE